MTGAVEHGASNAYNRGCRCSDCREGKRIRYAAWKASGPYVHEHGASAYRNQGCRCDVCRAGHAARARIDRRNKVAS